jgi:DNA replication protein DnaC
MSLLKHPDIVGGRQTARATVRRAAFEPDKLLENFDFVFDPEVPKANVIDLAACSFIMRTQDMLLVDEGL